ncbi:PTS glucitol/sorbitol transporter subunit IIA [Calorimonas adulescens]|uniref:PTS sorbitol transporter subunit IIA n=1 Tax=Calorimonas adulescens TaxID=2606906 RepID=A0A5D8QBG4_9THEO|nr:PTS glucitol/sorbitol transporter subunit IIA [Calorimonas adulescens]MDI6601233.1 PTS glucitol/sorbitol transporter subunit IIA [Thermoanaerobacteraceae bacterium]TZE81484.1 PTS sorbitol transporter subunit IIA [Calorimonas adulescens]
MVKYLTTVTAVGEQVSELKEANILIIFNEDAPKELAEISVLHTKEELNAEVRPGDILRIDECDYVILDVGDEVNKNLALLGHCCLKFDNNTGLLPGDVRVDGEIPDIKVGSRIKIYDKERI